VKLMRRVFIGAARALLGLGASGALGALGATVAYAGEARCAIELEGTSSAWSEAASALPESATAGDCARIAITAAGSEAATLTFITTDGREATRSLAHPDELAPALQALRERGPNPGAPTVAPPAPPAASPASPVSAQPEPTPAAKREPVSTQDDERPSESSGAAAVFALQTGARSGSSLVSPVLVLSAALAIERWELGVLVALEARYYDLGAGVPEERQTGAVGLGVGAGRREPIGNVELLAGVRTMIATLTHQVQEVSGPAQLPSQPEQTSAFEWRVGGYLGTVVPRQGFLRFRAELGADLVGSDRSSTSVADYRSEPPVAPEWAVTGLIGVELGGR
jgi:hypothetical protein